METPKFDIYPILAEGMAPDLHWYAEGVQLGELAATLALAALANTSGGTLFIGINPQSGKIQGVQDISAALDRVFRACLSTDPTLVIPVPRVKRVGRVELLVISVPQGLPHVYGLDGRYYWREGSQTIPIPPRKLRQLLVEKGMVLFESQSPPDVTYDDLDQGQIEGYAQAYYAAAKIEDWESQPGSKDILIQRGCLQEIDGEMRPSYAGLLLFGRAPQRWLPAAQILSARFSGHSFGDRFVKEEMNGSIISQLQGAEKFLRANIQSVVRMIGLTHQEVLEYPFEAVRELIVNAIAHRDYNLQGDSIHLNIFSDRLEVTSPGGLPGPITIDNILSARYSRNPVIVQVLADLGYVERLGYGLDRAVTSMRQNSLNPPEFEESAGTFRVTLHNTPTEDPPHQDMSLYEALDINPRQESALNYLGTRRRITNREFHELCPEVHPETLRRDLSDLVSKGVLIKIGDKKSTYYILKK
jgi:ATP-dependent DNA helicase RecG